MPARHVSTGQAPGAAGRAHHGRWDGQLTWSPLPARVITRRIRFTTVCCGPTGGSVGMRPLGAADPSMVGPYRLLGVLGDGGMSRVYLGQSPGGRRLAVKVVRAYLAQAPAFRRRFAREVAAAKSASPLFTAALVDADTQAESPWLATTYIEGPSLDQLLDGEGPLAPDAVLTLAAGLAEALASIHRRGLVHRELQPSHVIIHDARPHHL